MASGHRHHQGIGIDSGALDRVLQNEQVRARLAELPYHFNAEYDLPYVAGYSKSGDTLYKDRHLPETVKLQLDGQKKEISPDMFLLSHERLEKSLIDVLGYNYEHAHKLATAYEKRHVLTVLGPGWWGPYEKVMDKYIKADEHEKIQKVPSDLDMTPYYYPPVDKKLVAHMEQAMGKSENKKAKQEVDYSEGMAKSHCGPVKRWPHKGECEHFIPPHGCQLVRGFIENNYWCKLWESIDGREQGKEST